MPRAERRSEIDAVRGLAIVVMALDHARDFFGDHAIDALDLEDANVALFLARWITHFCAPTFIFLAGVSVALSRASLLQLALRGVWLVVLEQTLLRCFGWYFNVDYHFMNAGVLFGTGWAMVLLAVLLALRLPAVAIAALGAVAIATHAWLAGVVGDSGWWTPFLRSDDLETSGYHFYISYPIVPWFGVMALGYGTAALVKLRERSLDELRAPLRIAGAALLVLFIALRLLELGNPTPWASQTSLLFEILSFVNLEKYPPSIDFLALTLGGFLLVLSVADRFPAIATRILATYGRVPMFFYLAHIALIHVAAVGVALLRYGRAEWLYDGPSIFWYEALPGHPDDYGLSLPWVALVWIAVVAVLYPACAAYDRYKRTHDAAWLRYL